MRSEYTARRNALGADTTWRIGGEALEVHQGSGAVLRIPFDEVRSLNLRFHPTRYALQRCRCRVRGASASTTIDSVSYRGFLDFEDRAEAYTLFVNGLVDALSDGEAAFTCGASPPAYIATALLALGVVPILVLVVGWYLLSAGLSALLAVKVLLLLAMSPTLWRYLTRNKPGRFEPGHIPPSALP